MASTFPVIDAHTHLFPPDVVLDRTPHLDRDAWFGQLYASPQTRLVTPEDLIASMDEAGIAMSVVCGWPWKDFGLCREQNDFLADVHQRFADRIAWLAIVNPADGESVRETERALANGACGVGELNADAQGFDWADGDTLEPLGRFCVGAGVPVLMHCSEAVGHNYPGKGTATPNRILRFIQAHPELTVVAAHWGGGLPFHELMPEVAEVTRNVIYDSAASTYLYRFEVFPVVERLVGDGRIVFGTDFPLLNQRRFLRRVLKSGVSDGALPGILSGTAQRVFGLDLEATRR